MTFPLGSLRSDGGATTSLTRSASGSARVTDVHPPAGWRAQLVLLATGVLWLLAVLALATHSAGDSAFSTSGTATVVANKAGAVGAWFSDFAYFLFGYSVWWTVAVALRAWLGALARLLRSDESSAHGSAAPTRPTWLIWVGLGLLLAASSSLEWTRLYQWEARVAGGHAGGAIGYTLGQWTQGLFGFAGSGVLWIAALVAGIALSLRFSWLRLAERIGAQIDGLRERRVERIERAEDVRVGAKALREREVVVEVEHRLHEDHLPIVIEAPVVEVPKSERVVKERQKPLLSLIHI